MWDNGGLSLCVTTGFQSPLSLLRYSILPGGDILAPS